MHDASHEERCLLEGSGVEGCSECRAFLASMAAASDLARRAAVVPPAWLDARVLGQLRPAPARIIRPHWRRVFTGLAMAAAVMALMFAPWRGQRQNLQWRNGIESDLRRMDQELSEISRSINVSADPSEFEADLSRVEEMAQSLQKRL